MYVRVCGLLVSVYISVYVCVCVCVAQGAWLVSLQICFFLGLRAETQQGFCSALHEVSGCLERARKDRTVWVALSATSCRDLVRAEQPIQLLLQKRPRACMSGDVLPSPGPLSKPAAAQLRLCPLTQNSRHFLLPTQLLSVEDESPLSLFTAVMVGLWDAGSASVSPWDTVPGCSGPEGYKPCLLGAKQGNSTSSLLVPEALLFSFSSTSLCCWSFKKLP